MIKNIKNFKKLSLFLIAGLLAGNFPAIAQDISYQKPPNDITALINAPITPMVSFSNSGDFMLMMERSGHGSIEDLAQEELRIAGIRIDPATSGPSRSGSIENIKIKNTKSGKKKNKRASKQTSPGKYDALR